MEKSSKPVESKQAEKPGNPLPRIGFILAKLEPLVGLAKKDPLWKENLPIVDHEIDVAKKDLK